MTMRNRGNKETNEITRRKSSLRKWSECLVGSQDTLCAREVRIIVMIGTGLGGGGYCAFT